MFSGFYTVNKMKNYYIPKIEELCVGFVVERYVQDFAINQYKWEEITCDVSDLSDDASMCESGLLSLLASREINLKSPVVNDLRVKRLHVEDALNIMKQLGGNYIMLYRNDEGVIHEPIEIAKILKGGASRETIFKGKVRNLFELQRVIKMLRVVHKN